MGRLCHDLSTIALKEDNVEFLNQTSVRVNFNVDSVVAVHEIDSTWRRIPAARNCKLRLPSGEPIYVTATPNLPEYGPLIDKEVVLLRCTPSELVLCYFMRIVIIDEFAEMYPVQSKLLYIYTRLPFPRFPPQTKRPILNTLIRKPPSLGQFLNGSHLLDILKSTLIQIG